MNFVKSCISYPMVPLLQERVVEEHLRTDELPVQLVDLLDGRVFRVRSDPLDLVELLQDLLLHQPEDDSNLGAEQDGQLVGTLKSSGGACSETISYNTSLDNDKVESL